MSNTEVTVASVEFNTVALKYKEQKESELKEWMKLNLKQGLHEDWENAHIIWKRKLNDDEEAKPTLLDPGVGKIMGFMGVRPRHRIMEMTVNEETMHLKYVLATELVTMLPIFYTNPYTRTMDKEYPVIAEGVGSCTTREKRYKVKWEWFKEKHLITAEGYRPEELKEYREKYPDRFRPSDNPKFDNLYYMASAESLGLDNTLLKMAAKRSEMDAVFQIPGVAQRFSQEIDGLSLTEREKLSGKGQEADELPAPKVKSETPSPGKPHMKDYDPKEYDIVVADIQHVRQNLSRNVVDGMVDAIAGKQDLSKLEAALQLAKNLEVTGYFEDLDDDVELTVRQILDVKPAMKRAEVIRMMSDEKAKAAGLLTWTAAATMVASNLLSTKEMEPILYGEEQGISDLVYTRLLKAGLPADPDKEGQFTNLSVIDVKGQPLIIKPKKFMGDQWGPLNEAIKKLQGVWITKGKESHWEIPEAVIDGWALNPEA